MMDQVDLMANKFPEMCEEEEDEKDGEDESNDQAEDYFDYSDNIDYDYYGSRINVQQEKGSSAKKLEPFTPRTFFLVSICVIFFISHKLFMTDLSLWEIIGKTYIHITLTHS